MQENFFKDPFYHFHFDQEIHSAKVNVKDTHSNDFA